MALRSCEIPKPRNSCFQVSATPGCSDDLCLKNVCSDQPECCSGAYGSRCVATANRLCEPPTVSNGCFETSFNGGCNEPSCQAAVCAQDPSCCNFQWDLICVSHIATTLGANCTFPEPQNSCFEESIFGGCNDKTCSDLVCEFSPGCCNNDTHTGLWNDKCVNIAKDACAAEVVPRYVKWWNF